MEFDYIEQPVNRWTFKLPRLRKWLEGNCNGKVLNLFAGQTKLNVDEFRVDVSEEFSPDWLGDAFDFVSNTNLKFDTIILDPPYNVRQSRQRYNGKYIGSFTKIKNGLSRIMNDGCVVISFGYDSTGMARCRGFSKIALAVVNHKGSHNDTICLVEKKDFVKGK